MHLVAIYPGSFDPLTNGHLDIIDRATRFTDHLIVAILQNSQKQPLFPVSERVAMIRESTAHLPAVEVDAFDGLLVDYAAHRKASLIVRGIRAVSDYEMELQMAAVNRRLRPQTETIFLLGHNEHSFISSRMVRELISLHGDVSAFAPPAVLKRINASDSFTR